MAATEYVVLVDQFNQATGHAEKLAAHRQNLLHRAFSVFIFRQTATHIELLLQQRAAHKYHCPLLWSNTCCSHPRAEEKVTIAGQRRLQEELGISASLIDIGWFHYNAHFNNGLSENEIDHILVGLIPYHCEIKINTQEVQAYQWLSIEKLKQSLQATPTHFTPWLPLALPYVELYVNVHLINK